MALIMQATRSCRAACAILVMTALPVRGAVFNVAADFDNTISVNSGGQWQLGFLDSSDPVGSPISFLKNNENDGWISFDTPVGDGWTHSAGGGFPNSGQLQLPQGAISGSSLRDWPSAEGDNPDYPHGVIGGHSAAIPFFTGWYGVRFTAPSTDTYDITVNSWQQQVYPDLIPPNPLYGGNTRPHQLNIFKDDANTDASGQTLLARTPVVTRLGWINLTGAPEHVSDTAPIPGDAASWDTSIPAELEAERERAIGKSDNPTSQTINGVSLNQGETLIAVLAPMFFGGGQVQSGFHILDVEVRSGADRQMVTQWDLARDFSVHGSTSEGIGPDGAWTYGALNNGNLLPYDKIIYGVDGEDGEGARENHGLGSNSPGWFFSAATEPEVGPVTPVIIKDYDGNNFTTNDDGGGAPPNPSHTGDWSGGKVVVHVANDEVSAQKTSVIRWTAPRNMTIDAEGDLWRVVQQGLEGDGNRTQEYELVLNGSTVLASAEIGPNTFDCNTGTTSACAESFSITGQAVSQGDTLELLISPVDGGGTPLSADFDLSTVVDDIDLAILEAAYGVSDAGDATGDGQTRGGDLLEWQRQNGMSSGGGGEPGIETFVGVDFTVTEMAVIGGSAVPEPAALLLAAVSCVACSLSGRRKR